MHQTRPHFAAAPVCKSSARTKALPDHVLIEKDPVRFKELKHAGIKKVEKFFETCSKARVQHKMHDLV